MGKLYGQAPTTVYMVTALTNNSGFNATTFMTKWESTKGAMLYPPATLITVALSGNITEARVRLDMGGGVLENRTIFSYTTGAYNDEGVAWGFVSEPQNGDFTSTTETRALAREVKKLYGSVPTQVNTYSGEPRVAGTATFDASIFNANSTIKGIQGTISYLQFKDDADRVYLYAYLTDTTQIVLLDSEGVPGTFEEYGITQHVLDQVGYIDLTATTATQNLTKQIKKLYGSVNGETKVVYEAPNV